MERDELIVSRIEDRVSQCRDNYYITATGLLDSHEQALAHKVMRSSRDVKFILYGGYSDAERRMLVCIPADFPLSDEEAVDGLLSVLRVSVPRGSRKLTHRDYLGSVLGLGLDRSVTGDIIVDDYGADIIITTEIADFLMAEFSRVGRTEVVCELVPVSELRSPDSRRETIRDTVPSPRLDNIVSSAFKLSRSNAVTAIRSGIVSVDHVEITKPDARIEEGSSIVLRGKGKAILREFGGESKKGRTWVIIERLL